jgi:hypothetical protein
MNSKFDKYLESNHDELHMNLSKIMVKDIVVNGIHIYDKNATAHMITIANSENNF